MPAPLRRPLNVKVRTKDFNILYDLFNIDMLKT